MVPSTPLGRDPEFGTGLGIERALQVEIDAYRPWRSIAGSLLLHATGGLLLCLAAFQRASHTGSIAPAQTLVRIFVPSPSAAVNPPASPYFPPEIAALAVTETPAAAPPVAVDLNAIRLSFRADLRNQLPGVIEAQGGVLALLDKDNQAIARYVFRAPGWLPEETATDVAGQLRLLMDPPGKWPVFRKIAARDGINLDEFAACAIFDIAYRHCLQSAIRDWVPAGSVGHVTAARLAFRTDRPCGIEVLDVSVSAGPNQLTGK